MRSTEVDESFKKLKFYCESEGFKGWDPFDGLNSSLFQRLPLIKTNRLARLAWLQFFKRSPVNFRAVAGVPKEYNPKGLGLFLHGYCELYKRDSSPEYLQRIHSLAERLISLRTPGYAGSCWGYNFDWQARAFFQPKHTPTVVATTFIAFALFEAYNITNNSLYLDVALDTGGFVLHDLNRSFDKDGDFAFSYSPEDSTQVFNASLLGSRLLSRIYSFNGQEELRDAAERSVRFCCKYQQQNGAWSYGTLPFHHWVDNFHTGYNLECISDYAGFTGDNTFEPNLKAGLAYYLATFFNDPDGKPAYYNNRLYPIDIHNTSQLIITLDKLKVFKENKDMIDKVLNWTIENMQDSQGYFYYQQKNYFTSKIPYIRWVQAWMFYSMAVYLKNENTN